MFNSVLRAVLESYLVLCITMWYSWGQVQSLEPGLESRLSFLLTLGLTVACVGLPVFVFKFLDGNRARLTMASFVQRYGSLYQNIDRHNYEALVFTTIFLARRCAFAFVIVNVVSTVTFQVLCLDLLSTMVLSYYLLVFPMQDCLNNFIQIFNEIVILVCIWSLFLFTNYVPEPELRHQFGEYFIQFIIFNCGVNLVCLVVMILASIFSAIKTWFKRRTAKKKI